MTQTVRVGVGVILIRDNKILLGERMGSHGANTWSPPGGHLEFGENIETCAIRETEEETGLIISSVEKLAFTNDFFEKEEKHYVTLFVTASDITGEPHVTEPDKCKQWQWFELNALPQPLFLPLQNLLKEQAIFQTLIEIPSLAKAP